MCLGGKQSVAEAIASLLAGGKLEHQGQAAPDQGRTQPPNPKPGHATT